jgi:hypothetical protein
MAYVFVSEETISDHRCGKLIGTLPRTVTFSTVVEMASMFLAASRLYWEPIVRLGIRIGLVLPEIFHVSWLANVR